MKIVFLSNASGYGGSERTLETFSTELSKNHEVIVYAENSKHIELLKHQSIKVFQTSGGLNAFKILTDLFKMRKVLKEADCIIGNTNKSGVYLALAVIFFSFMRTKKIIVFVRDFQWKYLAFISRILKNKEFLVASKSVVNYLAPFKINPKILPNPVFLPSVGSFSEHAENMPATPVILCPAMISRWKGIDLLIQAIAEVNKSNPVKVVIIGKCVDREYYLELIELVRINNLQDCISFLNFSSDISSYYKSCSMVINSSISSFGGPETFGRTITEAWSYKKPVISFDCGGPGFLVDNKVNGLLIIEGNVKLLADGIKLLLTDQNLAESMGLSGYFKVKQEFSVEIICQQLIQKINKI